MARLLIKSPGYNDQVLELRLGVNRLGRASDNDFQIEHATLSSRHCEISVEDGMILVRDCESTNGTFVGGEQVKQAFLQTGDSFRAGDIEFYVENTNVEVAIPRFVVKPHVQPPVVLANGVTLCARHANAPVSHQCTFCKELMCARCVKVLKRRGGKALQLCPVCSHKVMALGQAPKKKSLLGILQKTIKFSLLSHVGKGAADNDVSLPE